MWPARLPSTLLCSLLPTLRSTLLFILLAGCSTPYRPAIVVHGSAPFPGIAGLVAASGGHPVDVLVVHGMCTRDTAWAEQEIDRIAGTVADHAPPGASARPAPGNGGIQVVERTRPLAGGTVRFHALVWSPLTAPLKARLAADRAGEPTDCARADACRPARARLNGVVKDKLLDDCLADVVIYEGAAGPGIRAALMAAVVQVLAAGADPDAPLAVVAESLGSKMLFDVLGEMLASSDPRLRDLGRQAAGRLGLLFMAGNQLPILALGEALPPDARGARAGTADALQRVLDGRRQSGRRADGFARLNVVAFTDPNDLLSYRLLPSRYAARDVAVADVLVSNGTTWLGLVADPVGAHLGYLENPDVEALIACGWPRIEGCH